MKNILIRLFNAEKLTAEEAKALLIGVATNQYNEAQVAALLAVYNMRAIEVDELAGFRSAMLELSVPIDLGEHRVIDLCGTGGDGKDTFNISTLSSFVVAAAGVKVAKHGNKSVSSKCGSSNVLEYLGVPFPKTNEAVVAQLEKNGICFLHAPFFHPAMKNVAPVRGALGVKTFFNMLGPLVNPAHPQVQLTGVFNLSIARLYYYLLQDGDTDFVVIHDLNGFDEVSLTGPIKVFTKQGESTFLPSDFGLEQNNVEDLYGGEDVAQSANIFVDILKGEGTKAQNNVVAANAGLAIATYENIPLKQGVEKAYEAITSKKALAVLEGFRN